MSHHERDLIDLAALGEITADAIDACIPIGPKKVS